MAEMKNICGKIPMDLHEKVREEIVHLALSTDDDILILDPESEFTKLVEALGGQVVNCLLYTSGSCKTL